MEKMDITQTHLYHSIKPSMKICLIHCKSVCWLMRGACISRFLASYRIPHRIRCGTSSARCGSCGGVGGVRDRFQQSLLCDYGLLPRKSFIWPRFLVPLFVEIPQQYVCLLSHNFLSRGLALCALIFLPQEFIRSMTVWSSPPLSSTSSHPPCCRSRAPQRTPSCLLMRHTGTEWAPSLVIALFPMFRNWNINDIR